MLDTQARPRLAIIGSGITGLGAAWALDKIYDVVVYEAQGRLGGHSNTVDVSLPDHDGSTWNGPVDTGFIVFNYRNYPNLVQLFDHLGVETNKTSMEFSVSIQNGRVEYRSERLLAQPLNAVNPRFLRMLFDIPRLYRKGQAILNEGQSDLGTLGEFLDQQDFGKALTQDHLLPMLGAIWSCPAHSMRDFPLLSILKFMNNHGLLSFYQQPVWHSVKGGSRTYVDRIQSQLDAEIRLSTPVASIQRDEAGVTLIDAKGGRDVFDQVIFACHSDQALKILGGSASQDERLVLSQMRYGKNRAVLHTDPKLMPKRQAAWGSWNYLSRDFGIDDSPIAVTYWMNRLQSFASPKPIFVTLNPFDEPDPATLIQEFDYDHPIFDQAALKAQTQLASIQGKQKCWFGGAYAGNGFHEDGLQAGLSLAQALGACLPWSNHVMPISPSARLVDLAGQIAIGQSQPSLPLCKAA